MDNKTLGLEFPSKFVIKAVGVNVPNLIPTVSAIIAKYCTQFDPDRDISLTISKKSNFLSISATITAESREQLDKIYQELNNHELIKITL